MKLDFWLLPQVTWISDNEIRRLQAALALTGAACATDWGQPIPSVSIASRASDIPDSGTAMVLSPTIDAPGDLAYHTLLDGKPYCLVLAAEVANSLGGVQTAASHELKETVVDPLINLYVTLQSGNQIPVECCDPTEGDTIPVDLGAGDLVLMSNHVKRAWFTGTSGDGQSYDAKGVCPAPRVIRPNGYSMLIAPNGAVSQLGVGPAAYKMHPAFRFGRRLASIHALGMRLRAFHAAGGDAL